MQLTGNSQCGPRTAITNPCQRHIPGEAGIWVFIFGDLALFAYLFLLYLHYRTGDPALFARSQRHLNIDLGVVYTLLLLTSSLFAVLAMQLIRSGNGRRAAYFVLAAMVCGVAFVGVKVGEYYTKAHSGITPNTNNFYLFYYILTGLHLTHVVVGLGVLAFAWTLARRAPNLSRLRLSLAEGSTCFWHMVDLVWLVIFPLLYLVR